MERITALDRLAIVGNSGKGALTCEPEFLLEKEDGDFDLDMLAAECEKVLQAEYTDALDEWYMLGGTSGGARPKIMTEYDQKEWIIKFPAHTDGNDAGGILERSGLTVKRSRSIKRKGEESMNAIFYGVGVGSGDPELLTLKAVRVIEECDILAVPGKTKEDSVAYGIALSAVPQVEQKETVCIHMPMTKDEKKLRESHESGAAQIISLLKRGKSVAFLTLGDPTVYSTYLYLQKLVEEAGHVTKIINGVTSFSAAGAALNIGLVEKDQQLHVIPSSYGIEDALKLPGTKVLMKAGKKMPLVKEALTRMDADVYMVENCGMSDERMFRDADEIPEHAGYYSLIILKDR